MKYISKNSDGEKLALKKDEIKVLIKLLEHKLLRFSSEDLIHMLRGPRYHYILDDLYQECFRPHIKYGASVINEGKEADEKEREIIHAMWERVNRYLQEELNDIDG